MNDDLGNTESTYFQAGEPEEQVKERLEEKGKVLEGMRLLEDIITHFEKRINFYESTKAIPEDVRTNTETFMHTVTSNDLTADNLRQEKDYLEGLRETHK